MTEFITKWTTISRDLINRPTKAEIEEIVKGAMRVVGIAWIVGPGNKTTGFTYVYEDGSFAKTLTCKADEALQIRHTIAAMANVELRPKVMGSISFSSMKRLATVFENTNITEVGVRLSPEDRRFSAADNTVKKTAQWKQRFPKWGRK